MYEDIGKALGTDYFHIRDELSTCSTGPWPRQTATAASNVK